MIWIAFAALFSVLVSVLLKMAPRRGIDVAQAVTWNYLIASALCVALLNPPLDTLRLPQTPWWALLTLALVLPSLFLVLAASVRQAGIVRTDIAQRLSLLLSLLAAFTVFGERASVVKLVGVGVGILAMLAIVARPEKAPQSDSRAIGILLTVWVGFAVVDVALKGIARAGVPFSASLQVCFGLAFLSMFLWQLYRHWQGIIRLRWRNVVTGFLLGGLNFGNIVCYVRAHQALPDNPAVVFASMNIGVVLLGTLVGMGVFHEPTSRWNRIGIPLAIVAIAVIAFAPKG